MFTVSRSTEGRSGLSHRIQCGRLHTIIACGARTKIGLQPVLKKPIGFSRWWFSAISFTGTYQDELPTRPPQYPSLSRQQHLIRDWQSRTIVSAFVPSIIASVEISIASCIGQLAKKGIEGGYLPSFHNIFFWALRANSHVAMPRQVGSPNATRRSDHVQGLVCHGKIIHVQNNMVATTIASVARYRNKANSSRMITRRSTKRAHLGADKNRCQFVFLSEQRRLRAAIERVSEIGCGYRRSIRRYQNVFVH